ncbi:DUF4956 domain-containing protein [Prolixibacteraceae bacterium Z1-6]|uniref:DUF4956 domain-containing protein n=1 Tax=Draconibacterium aestuarii TaxID=2998507 RepID=A0A9X3F928_9BACT|nr:DUF4956 domain-containing protein [Prolixibacteraceae bacterium Z1-6]
MGIVENTGNTMLDFSGIPWMDFTLRLVVNIVSTFVLIRFIYYPKNSRVKYLFTFFLMGLMIFCIASILDSVSIDIGLAFGLFAIFGIIRYRSPSIDLKEMTYLFLVIGISIINALVVINVSYWIGLVIANGIILLAAFVMEHYIPKNYVIKRSLIFSPSSFSVLNNKQLLLNEICKNTGIEIQKVEVEKINKSKNEITAWIYFKETHDIETLSFDDSAKEPPKENVHWESTYSSDYE